MRFPNNTEHVSIIGQNGSGKTQFAAFLLSRSNFSDVDYDGVKLPQDERYFTDSRGRLQRRNQPWIIIDYKLDPLLNHRRLKKRIQTLSLTSSIPTDPGLYIVHPGPNDAEALEDFLWRVWQQGKVGLWFDEAHMLPVQEKGAFQGILTQGRTKKIPCIVLTQKPSWVSRFVFSEAKFFCVFRLNDARDHKVVQNFVPVDMSKPLPRYHSYWYDSAEDEISVLQPAPNSETILSTFEHRMPRRWLR